ncbi:uncharacterized protein J7T54_003748 [Emericellopsis cladophorae]|uniref:Uncharacterized protein n=1 Tax=Emericellopsis cladophorae TaxID=2686198 RepID=A0A9Q0BD54_9HYPO|nr:uncharacterized protein J7T54_003748 [Emericellopsis cladophorae]KAI6779824.1 hypothetical protein J7T54_003748 [Emericellopsis cladophorae]
MSSSQQPLTGTDGIRSLNHDDAIFHAFDSYPWVKDTNFMSGLLAILGSPTDNPQASFTDMATHARIFYYAQKIGVTIDFSRYKEWLDSHPDHAPPDVLPDEYRQQPQQPALDWQKSAPKAELFLDRKPGSVPDQAHGEDQPSYPGGFAEMIKLLQEGKPVPGIRQIPNTVVRDPVSAAAPQNIDASNHEGQTQALDPEFPPVDTSSQPDS